jgi:hypothetical protein
MREKTASASESLANNLAANGADIEVAVHGGYLWAAAAAASRANAPFWPPLPPNRPLPRG